MQDVPQILAHLCLSASSWGWGRDGDLLCAPLCHLHHPRHHLFAPYLLTLTPRAMPSVLALSPSPSFSTPHPALHFAGICLSPRVKWFPVSSEFTAPRRTSGDKPRAHCSPSVTYPSPRVSVTPSRAAAVAQSCLTLCNPMDYSLLGSSVHSILQARILEWVATFYDAKSWLIGKDPDAGKDWRQEQKGTTEDKMVGWHHWLNGHGFGWTLGAGDGQGGLACCGSWGCKESDTTERLNWTELNIQISAPSLTPSSLPLISSNHRLPAMTPLPQSHLIPSLPPGSPSASHLHTSLGASLQHQSFRAALPFFSCPHHPHCPILWAPFLDRRVLLERVR